MMDRDGADALRDLKGGKSMAGEERDRIEDFRAPPFPEDFPAHLGRLEDLLIGVNYFCRCASIIFAG